MQPKKIFGEYLMEVQIIAAAVSFVITVILMPAIIRMGVRLGIVDRPGGRRIHKKSIPRVGGVGIILSLLIAFFFWSSVNSEFVITYFFAAIIIIFLIGLRDDVIPMHPFIKLLSICTCAVMIIYFYHIRIDSLYGLLPIDSLTIEWSYFITVFVILGLTNGYNLADGSDGLAGTIGSIVSLFLGIWFAQTNDYVFSMIMFCVTGAIFGFLRFNMHPARVFMGDSGSLTIGFLLSIAIIRFLQGNEQLPEGHEWKLHATVGSGMALMFYPIYDTVRVMLLRIISGKSPFSPDKKHTHHLLLRMGLSHSQIAFVIGLYSLINVLFIWLFGRWISDWLFIALLLLFSGLCYAFLYLRLKRYIGGALEGKMHYRKKRKRGQ